MSAFDHVSPQQLNEIAKKVHEEHFSKWGLHNPKWAEGMCDTCTNTFLRESRVQGARGQWLHGETPTGFYINHKIAHVPTTEGTHVVDLTYNQFVNHPEIGDETKSPVPVPLVEPLEKFMKRPLMSRMRVDEGDDDYPEWLENHPRSTDADKDPYLKYGVKRI